MRKSRAGRQGSQPNGSLWRTSSLSITAKKENAEAEISRVREDNGHKADHSEALEMVSFEADVQNKVDQGFWVVSVLS